MAVPSPDPGSIPTGMRENPMTSLVKTAFKSIQMERGMTRVVRTDIAMSVKRIFSPCPDVMGVRAKAVYAPWMSFAAIMPGMENA